MTVYNLKLGQKGIIDNIAGNEKLMKRLLALGLIDGTEVEVKKIAPLNDPIVIRFRGFDLAIRKSDAKNINLKNNMKNRKQKTFSKFHKQIEQHHCQSLLFLMR